MLIREALPSNWEAVVEKFVSAGNSQALDPVEGEITFNDVEVLLDIRNRVRRQLTEPQEFLKCVREQKKIPGIKALREALGLGLKEAKEAYEGLWNALPAEWRHTPVTCRKCGQLVCYQPKKLNHLSQTYEDAPIADVYCTSCS